MSIVTNAKDKVIASTLSALDDSDQGNLFFTRVHKVGVSRGPYDNPVVYGDDTVDVLIWAGFSYHALVARSLKMLERDLTRGGYIERIARAALEEHGDVTIENVCHALQDTRGWLRKVLQGPANYFQRRTESGVWGPLVINGVEVGGGVRVYLGETTIDRVRGTIYVQGLKLGEQVVMPAARGSWRANSSPKTVAKRIIKEGLPIGLYCQYRLDPERVSNTAVGAEASRLGKQARISIDPDALRSLFKVAP